jgi:hypothetical protein
VEYGYEAEHFYAQEDATGYYFGSPGALGSVSLVDFEYNMDFG